jgi:hypothetical protein
VKWKIDMSTKCYFKIKYTIRNGGLYQRNRKEVYGLIKNAVYPKKINKATKCDPLIEKLATVVFKMNYWKLILDASDESSLKATQRWKKMIAGEKYLEKKKIIDKVKLIRNIKKKSSKAIANLCSIMKEKIWEPAKALLEKEMKAKRKKLRRKWKKLVNIQRSDKLDW